MELTRRNFLKTCAAAGVAVTTASCLPGMHLAEAAGKDGGKMKYPENMQVPYSTGRDVPTIVMPKDACDTHHHIYDPVHFPYLPTDKRNQPPATVEIYRMLQHRLGLTRNVIIQPSAYGTDNSCILAAAREMGKKTTRAVVVVDPKISDHELETMAEQGACGIRYNVSRGAKLESAVLKRMADRIRGLGWNIQFWMPADMTVEFADTLKMLPVPLVFDHRGHLPQTQGTAHPAFQVITELMRDGRGWVKLSGLYQDSNGENNYADTVAVGQAYVAAEPSRVIWGTDWPHPSEFSAKKDMPNDAQLLNLLAAQAQDEQMRHRILVENPAELYHF